MRMSDFASGSSASSAETDRGATRGSVAAVGASGETMVAMGQTFPLQGTTPYRTLRARSVEDPPSRDLCHMDTAISAVPLNTSSRKARTTLERRPSSACTELRPAAASHARAALRKQCDILPFPRVLAGRYRSCGLGRRLD